MLMVLLTILLLSAGLKIVTANGVFAYKYEFVAQNTLFFEGQLDLYFCYIDQPNTPPPDPSDLLNFKI